MFSPARFGRSLILVSLGVSVGQSLTAQAADRESAKACGASLNTSPLPHAGAIPSTPPYLAVRQPPVDFRTGEFVVVAPGREFLRTNRSIKHLARIYPAELLDPATMRGLRVLDVGAADGAFVNELRQAGVDAHGIDLVVRPQDQNEFLRQGDARAMPYPDHSFDLIFSTYSVFADIYFATNSDGQYYESASRAAAEVLRVLKPGGVAYLGPLSGLGEKPWSLWINQMHRAVPQLRVKFIDCPVNASSAEFVVRIEKPPGAW